MKIEAGKFYRTRDGHKVGPIREWDKKPRFDGLFFPWIGNLDKKYKDKSLTDFLFKEDGSNYEFTDLDIVGEWNEMKIEAGKTYVTADGTKIGPMITYCDTSFIEVNGDARIWDSKGKYFGSTDASRIGDLVAEFNAGPVREVIRKEIVSGKFGPLGALEVGKRSIEKETINLRILTSNYTKAQVGEFIKLLAEIEGAM